MADADQSGASEPSESGRAHSVEVRASCGDMEPHQKHIFDLRGAPLACDGVAECRYCGVGVVLRDHRSGPVWVRARPVPEQARVICDHSPNGLHESAPARTPSQNPASHARTDKRAEAQRHYDAVADTGDAYSAFHGWVLTCTWCPHQVREATKAEALAAMQQHYDGFATFGLRMTVLASKATK